ncbi:unnamed protein product [Blepharisma stoltei]|uniref:Uncharacterized protein n=1 Tax=Blepharisma stoltei TaxID=1481888 RepID=A0AAU9JS06_9CILI|nr:unnamed protein product [Blepharisma stoltei]
MALSEGKDKIEGNPSLYLNSHRRQKVADILRLRAGFNAASYSQNLRHLKQSSKYEKCKWNEKEIHLFNDCLLNEDERADLLMELGKNGMLEEVIRRRFVVHDVELYVKKFVVWMKEEHAGEFGEVDDEIKTFIYRVKLKKKKREKCGTSAIKFKL